jgi:hypothetical protein
MTKRKDPKDYKKMGRPGWEYYEPLGLEICEAIATSVKGLKHLCAAHEDWPDDAVIYRWVLQVPDFASKYAHARELQQEVRVNYAFDLTQSREGDMYSDDKGTMRPNMANIARDKLITDTVKWEAGRLARKYKDRKEVDQHNTNHETSLKDLE